MTSSNHALFQISNHRFSQSIKSPKPTNPINHMKTKKNLFLQFPKLAIATGVIAISSQLHAATFTWDGDHPSSNSWGSLENWNPNGVPTFDNTADLGFNTLTRPANFISENSTVRSLTFGSNIDSAYAVRLVGFPAPSFAQVARSLTFDADSGNTTITVDTGAEGNINIGLAAADTGTTYGNPILADNLVVNHNGTGLLLFNRPFQAAAFGITKTGTGPMQTNNNNLLTGTLNIDGGTLIANSFSATGLDLANFTAINLGGCTLQIGSAGLAKTYAAGPITVTAASTLEYRNPSSTTYNAAFTGTGFVLNADLAVKNVSTDTTLTNAFSLNRPITGTGKITTTTYNNITTSADNFVLGRVSLGGDNSSWNGGITIANGTFLLGGTAVNSAGTGLITIGTTGASFGAGMTFFPGGSGGSTVTYPNNITVSSGGFRAIKGGGTNHSVTFTGNIALNGNLTLDHTWSTADRRISMSGAISGPGGLTITRAGGSAGTTAVLSGTNTYPGNTTVTAGASLSLAITGSLTSNIAVENLARIGGAGSTTGSLTLQSGAKFFFFFAAGFAPMNVAGTVTLDNSFDINNGLVGGSQGEVIPWANVAPGTYTLIGGTASTFNTGGSTNNIANFGVANAVTVVAGKTAYFQNGGGTSGGGLQLVVTGPSGFDSWKTTNGTAGGLGEDHDNDGVANGTEYFLFGSASSTGFTALPGVINTAGVRSITWPAASINAGYGGVYGTHFTVETSDTLEAGSWVTAPLGTGAGAVSIPFATAAQVRNVKYTFPTTGPKKFARLKVTGP